MKNSENGEDGYEIKREKSSNCSNLLFIVVVIVASKSIQS